MPGPVERWLETFMCKQYADTFEAYGFKTLQSVCQLQLHQLQGMGVAQEHCEKILENVHVLRQTLIAGNNKTTGLPEQSPPSAHDSTLVNSASSVLRSVAMNVNLQRGPMNHYPEDMPNPYGANTGRMALSSDYLTRDNPRMMSRGMSGYPLQSYGDHPSSHMMLSQQTSFHGHNAAAAAAMYNQHNQSQQFMGQRFSSPYQASHYSSMGAVAQSSAAAAAAVQMSAAQMSQLSAAQMSSMASNSMYSSSPASSSSSSHNPHSHPYMRHSSSCQNPQQVADNILQMASVNYPSNQTVHVPINKSRTAPYHLPRSPQYSMQTCNSPVQPQMRHNAAQYGYPSTSPHPPAARTSPISPMLMHSPASHHSNQSMPNSSPVSLHSPAPANVKSPVTTPSPITSSLRSPCAVQSMTSPVGCGKQICSPPHSINSSSGMQQSPLGSNSSSGYVSCNTSIKSPGPQHQQQQQQQQQQVTGQQQNYDNVDFNLCLATNISINSTSTS